MPFCQTSKHELQARELGELLNIKVVHIDRIFWRSDWESVSQKDLERNIEKYLNKYRKLILDGDYLFNIEQRLSYADAFTAFVLAFIELLV